MRSRGSTLQRAPPLASASWQSVVDKSGIDFVGSFTTPKDMPNTQLNCASFLLTRCASFLTRCASFWRAVQRFRASPSLRGVPDDRAASRKQVRAFFGDAVGILGLGVGLLEGVWNRFGPNSKTKLFSLRF